ncbi:hypothetical protein E1B28_003519 [Marasmius oreades]|uniref:Uncharacterized protein n=1 Tax=Marasmius oreades TaxID=181124 RepID=A0A9P7UMJ9_9AGAR|nr:uncharacterized protein E1B28_003519 [Marasmius oreades]KAG7085996.1 hypothetical protein E1B28_003519 [Marasmius oreades]
MASSPLLVLFFSGWSQILLYGLNTVLFVTGIYLLGQRERREGTTFIVLSSVLLFAFASISAVVGTASVVGGYLSIPLVPGTSPSATGINLSACSIIQYVVLHLVDFTAFMILVYRCFSIWGRNYLVIVIPVVIILAETGVYYYELRHYIKIQFASGLQQQTSSEVLKKSLAFTTAALILAAVANALLTLLIAGRIWWLKRRVQHLTGNGIIGNLPQKYDSIIAITMESGMIIPIFLIIYTVYSIRNTSGDHDALVIMAFMLPQVIAFAPLLIMVRVGLGLTVERDHVKTSSSYATRSTTNQSRSQPHLLNISRDIRVSVSMGQPDDVELDTVPSKGRAF